MATDSDLDTRLRSFLNREQDALECPFPMFDELRDSGASLRWSEDMGAWIATSHEAVQELLRDTDNWSSFSPTAVGDRGSMIADAMMELAQDPEMAAVIGEISSDRRATAVLLNADPPEHVRQRRSVNGAFRPSKIRAYEPVVNEVANRLVDDFIERGSVEFVAEFAVLLPMEIIAKALGVDDRDLLTFKRWSDAMVMPVGNASPSVEQVKEFVICTRDFNEYCAEQLQARLDAPRDDLLSDVAHAEVDGERLSLAEQISMCTQFLVAGNETTTKLITNIARHLATDPGLQQQVRSNPELAAPLVEEALRFEAPVQGLFRCAKRDLDFQGVSVAKGQFAWAAYAAANRDPGNYECPNEVRLDRETSDHLAFGHGEHFCIGAGLARLEAVTAVNVLLARLNDIEIAEGWKPTFEDSYILRGLRTLDLKFRAAD